MRTMKRYPTRRRLKAHPTKYNGTRFRSKLEALWAAHFDSLGAVWVYEPFRFVFAFDEYIPDFLIIGEHSKVIEIKPQGFVSKHDYTRIADELCKVNLGFDLRVGLPPEGHRRVMHPCRKPSFPERVLDLRYLNQLD